MIECGYLRVFSQSGRVDAHAAYRNNDGALIFINVSGVDEAGTQPNLMDTYISPSQLPAPRYDIYPPRTSCPPPLKNILVDMSPSRLGLNMKLIYRRGTARCVVTVEILPIATQQCSTTSPEQIEIMNLEG